MDKVNISIKRDGLKVSLTVEGRQQTRQCNNLEEAVNLYNDYKAMIDLRKAV